MAGVLTLRRIGIADYARLILPQTASLWAGKRSFQAYTAQTLEVAQSAYGRRHFRTFGLFDGKRLVASFKRYGRSMHLDSATLRAGGIGAVFTPAEFRGRGYASLMLAAALDAARASGDDLAFLFSDIAPQFYAALGFVALPSREFSLRADALPSLRLAPAPLRKSDWPEIARCFDAQESARAFGFRRTPPFWDYLRLRLRAHAAVVGGDETNLVVRQGQRIVAYALGTRDARRDTYVLDEFASTVDAQTMPALLRAAAGDLRRIAGWLPPVHARGALPPVTIRRRRRAVFMAAPLTARGKQLIARLAAASKGDPCWNADHV